MIQLFPGRHGVDGFFIAKMRRDRIKAVMKQDILDKSPEEITDILKQIGEPSFRGKQLLNWLYRGTKSFEDMTNLPKHTRIKLKERYMIGRVKQIKKMTSDNSDTIKYLCLLHDSNIIECVVMRYDYRTPYACPPKWSVEWAAVFVNPPGRASYVISR